jgi:hypothetical protein
MSPSPIRVCIGTEPRTEIPRKVLEHSIRKHTDRPLELHALSGGDWSGTGPLQQYTGFSLLRWTIPERCGFEGRAIYLDADQLCLANLGELWDVADGEAAEEICVWCTRYEHRTRNRFLPFLRRRRVLAESSVMLLDCARACGRLRTFAQISRDLIERPTQDAYDEVMHLTYLEPPPAELSPWWNVMDGRGGAAQRFLDSRARILHFTRVATQPWYCPDHPARPLWETHLAEALDAGLVARAEIEAACARFSRSQGRLDGMHPYWRQRFLGQ